MFSSAISLARRLFEFFVNITTSFISKIPYREPNHYMMISYCREFVKHFLEKII